jgi:hypothetical protein
MAGLEASRALEKCEKGVQENARTLKESSLTAQCYNKIRRLHDDKISFKSIAAEVTSLHIRVHTHAQPYTCAYTHVHICHVGNTHAHACALPACLVLLRKRFLRALTPAHCCQVGCSTLEVQAALWKPTASNAFTLFKSSEAVRARTAAAGVPFAEMTKLVSKLWDEAKRNGTSSPFEVYLLCLCACVACATKPAPVSDAHSCLSVCVCAWVCRCRRSRRSTQ